ncbi:MAG: hypothetical protein CFH01_01658, partial [Alphaproteobacteria bacterium MarineAlpha2_Bin1]
NISNKIQLIWPKNIKEISNSTNKQIEIKDNIEKAPIKKVSREKLLIRNINKKNITDKIEKNDIQRKTKVEQKNALISSNIISSKKNKQKPFNKVKKIKPLDDKNKKISRLNTKPKSSDTNIFQRIIFEPTQTNVREKYRSELSEIASFSIKKKSRILIKAYASTSGNRPTYARRVSLSRALAIRTELIQYGVNSTDIDVRALGEVKDGNQPDRVDVSIMPQ